VDDHLYGRAELSSCGQSADGQRLCGQRFAAPPMHLVMAALRANQGWRVLMMLNLRSEATSQRKLCLMQAAKAADNTKDTVDVDRPIINSEGLPEDEVAAPKSAGVHPRHQPLHHEQQQRTGQEGPTSTSHFTPGLLLKTQFPAPEAENAQDGKALRELFGGRDAGISFVEGHLVRAVLMPGLREARACSAGRINDARVFQRLSCRPVTCQLLCAHARVLMLAPD
jgi:hypothetical protein